MIPEAVRLHAREKGLSQQDASQTFLQVVVLRHLSEPKARFMGGTALVLGYGNPRFSEDVDLTQVRDPELLKAGLVRAKAEIEGWFASPTVLLPPKKGLATWRLTVRLGRAESISLHVDSQPYKAYTSRPIVIQYPSLPSFVCSAVEVDEIMADKILAVACRRYLGGRDLFDLWFHWLRSDADDARCDAILGLVGKKARERKLDVGDLRDRLASRLSGKASLERAREEWRRYLPSNFQKREVLEDIVLRCRSLEGVSL